jgi:uncharacterized protein YyaL (SSP411 family)
MRRADLERRARLFALRNARVRPGCDDKVLTAWNALAIDGMAFAARGVRRTALGRIGAARARFHSCGAVARRPVAGHPPVRPLHLNAYLDDYASLLGAVLE